jgi:drug/metabolite transporter (DMT)-like permease
MVKRQLLHIDNIQIIFMQSLIGSSIFLIWHLFIPVEVSFKQLGLGVFYGLTVGHLGFYLFYQGLKKLRMDVAIGLTYLEVPLSVIVAYCLLGESISSGAILGGLLVLSGCYLVSKKVR